MKREQTCSIKVELRFRTDELISINDKNVEKIENNIKKLLDGKNVIPGSMKGNLEVEFVGYTEQSKSIKVNKIRKILREYGDLCTCCLKDAGFDPINMGEEDGIVSYAEFFHPYGYNLYMYEKGSQDPIDMMSFTYEGLPDDMLDKFVNMMFKFKLYNDEQ